MVGFDSISQRISVTQKNCVINLKANELEVLSLKIFKMERIIIGI